MNKNEHTVKLLRNMDMKTQTPGYHQVLWDGCDKGGKSLSSGLYFYGVTAGKESFMKKFQEVGLKYEV